MFPSVLFKEEAVKGKMKERQWEDRVAHKPGPGQSSPQKEKHIRSYRKLMVQSTSKLGEVQSPSKPRKSTYFQKRIELIDRIKAAHPNQVTLISSYEDLSGKHKLPTSFVYYTLLPLLSLQDAAAYLLNEVRQLKEQSTHYHRIHTAIAARQECLGKMRKTFSALKEESLAESKGELKTSIQHLRLLTTNVIDQMKRWRDYLQLDELPFFEWSPQRMQENYLILILNDNRFIFHSPLAKHLQFGDKNDPFILTPLKRSSQPSNQYLSVVETNKELAYYQKYIEYLASEKAYEEQLHQTPKKKEQFKSPAIQRVYRQSIVKEEQEEKPKKEEEDGWKTVEVQKLREERLRKNEERIQSIKNIYETYRKSNPKEYKSERKAGTDSEAPPQKKPKVEKLEDERQFDSLVRNKAKRLEVKAQKHGKMVESKSEIKIDKPSKLEKLEKLEKIVDKSEKGKIKTEQKMIESLQNIQSTLRSKLQLLQSDRESEEVDHKYARKTNDELIRELKTEILGKLEKEAAEKDRLRKKRREEEEKALQEIKDKMKREMEEKLEQKKKEKMLEREELQRKLREEEERLNSQRQLEAQLQLKIAKEKELRQVEKLRREAIQRQKIFQQQLEKEQKARKEHQILAESERKQKEALIQQLKKKEMKEQIQEELRAELAVRHKDKGKEEEEFGQLRAQKQVELSKQIELLKSKEGVELEQLKKQNQLKERMLKFRREEEQLKRREVEHLMKTAIQGEKEDLQRDALRKRVQLEESMRANVKEKMLEEYRNEKEAQVEQLRFQRERQLEEDVYREKVREKIERDMRMEAIQRTKKELDLRQTRKLEMNKKMETVKQSFQNDSQVDRSKIQVQVKRDLIEKVIFDKQAEKEAAKHDLRMQFERELMASAVPQIYQQRDSFLLKDTAHLNQDSHLNSKLDLPTNQRPAVLNITGTSKKVPTELRSTLNDQQLLIYTKQKEHASQMREENIVKPQPEPEEPGFEPLKISGKRKEKESDHEVQIAMRKVKKQEAQVEKQYEKKKPKKHKKKRDSSASDESIAHKKRKSKARKVFKDESDDSNDSDSEAHRPKKKTKKKNKKQSSSESEEPQVPISQAPKETAEGKVHFDAQNTAAKLQQLVPIEPITIRPTKPSLDKFTITLDAIPQANLDEYLQVHISRLPQRQRAMEFISREELYRQLTGELTFCLLIGWHDGKAMGMALAYHDRNRSDLRKFSLVHVGTYRDDDFKEFLLSVTNYIFRKDPCDEIDFHLRFNEAVKEQLETSTDFNRWFDKFGNVFQKKIEEKIYERKYNLKRQFHQKCEVLLGGINKNTFRNIFSLTTAVLMSDAEMLQSKEELRDALSPQNQVSYSIMIAELFRTYLTPDEADSMKGKVKEFAKLKELLVLVVMLQKKKVKLEELKMSQYRNLIELNMKLMSQGKEVIRFCKDGASEINRLYYCELNHSFNLPFHFQTTSLPVEARENQVRQISYFRLSPLPPHKLHIIKSSLYNAEMSVLPTENSKYKIFVLNAQEYNEIKEDHHLDLFMYIRLFLKNVKSHNVAVWKYVWLPQMADKASWAIRQFKSFLSKDFYTHDSINISYRQFLPGALIIEPEHRDLVLTPPFIVGVMSMGLEQVTEGSPLYARLIQIDALKTLQIEQSVI